jgi:hypothetical protein
MRKTLILLVVCLVLLWVSQASAYYRGLAKPKFGDPDEFQTCKYHDEADVRFEYSCRGRQSTAAKTMGREEQPKREVRRYLSISFAGITFFLER